MDNWEPIATAPRDGANILLRFGEDGVSQGKFILGGVSHPWKFIDTNDGITWLVNHAVDGPGGPSHWQPLPSTIRGVAPVEAPSQDAGTRTIHGITMRRGADGSIDVTMPDRWFCASQANDAEGNLEGEVCMLLEHLWNAASGVDLPDGAKQ